MTITQVSQKYGLSQDTLRYYERIGIIPPVPRNKSGIRDYDEVSCSWIELMKCMRSSGIQIEALIEYVTLFQQGDATLDARKALLIDQRDQLLERMEQMQQSLGRLNQKIENYEQVMAAAEAQLGACLGGPVRGLGRPIADYAGQSRTMPPAQKSAQEKAGKFPRFFFARGCMLACSFLSPIWGYWLKGVSPSGPFRFGNRPWNKTAGTKAIPTGDKPIRPQARNNLFILFIK